MIRMKGRWAMRFSARRTEEDVPSWVGPDAGGETAGRPEERDSSPEEETEESERGEDGKEEEPRSQKRIRQLTGEKKALKEELATEKADRAQEKTDRALLERRMADLERSTQASADAARQNNGDSAASKATGFDAFEKNFTNPDGKKYDEDSIAFARGIYETSVQSARAEYNEKLEAQVGPLREVVLKTMDDTAMGQLKAVHGPELVDKYEAATRAYHSNAANAGRYLEMREAFALVVPAKDIVAAQQKTTDAQTRLRNEAGTLEGGPDREREDPGRPFSADEQEVVDRMREAGVDSGAIDAMRKGVR